MKVLRTLPELRQWRAQQAAQGHSVGFVPTMGALHSGHLQLVAASRQACDATVVSIFVNPTQFAPHEDFGKYPRTYEADALALQTAGADALFYPDMEMMYPPGGEIEIRVPRTGALYEGITRPHFFHGVALVVTKLFNLVQPTKAFFGQKDYQQTVVIRRMVADLFMPLEVVVCPTVREADGLAMSSRNRYLSPEQRASAAGLYQTLLAVANAAQPGASGETLTQAGLAKLAQYPDLKLDYLAVAHPLTLEPIGSFDPETGAVALLAVFLGATRLIDNLVLPFRLAE